MISFGLRAQRPFIKGAACCLVAGCMALSLSGCVYSSTITEVIHVQDEQYGIDPDADPIYVNSVLAEVVSDQIPSLVPMTQGVLDYIENMPTYDGDLSNAEVRESREGIEEFLSQFEHSSQNGSKWEAGDGSQKDEEEQSSGQQTTASNRNESDRSWLNGTTSTRDRNVSVSFVAGARSSDSGNKADQGDATGSSNGSGNGAAGNGADGQAGAGGGQADGSANAGDNGNDPNAASSVGRNPGSTFGDVGSIDDVPEGVHTVAAVGNAAIVCASLGGADGDPNLVAADDQLLGGNASYVLAARSIGSAAAVWRGDGSSSGQLDMDALLQLAPDAVVVSEGEGTLTDDDVVALNAAGTHVVFVPNMSAPDRAEICVQRIGNMLGKGGDSQAQALGNDYVALVEDLRGYVDGVGAYVLYVDSWQGGDYYGARSDVQTSGAAFAPIGESAQPISACLEWGGVVNVAASKSPYNVLMGGSIVWPFAGGTDDAEWAGIAGLNPPGVQPDTRFARALTQYAPYNNVEEYRLGGDGFRCVITPNAGVRDAIVTDRDNDGVYSSAHDDTSIASNDYDVIVNPHGVFSSWVSGSMESVLETPWAYMALVPGSDDGGSFHAYVSDFYQHFYGFADVDVDAIASGAYAG